MATPNLGALEQLLLLALVRLGDEAYGVSVRREVVRRTGRSASLGAIYSTLARLEEKGLVVSRLGEPTPERGGRRKKHFTLAPAGRRALEQNLRTLRTMTQGLDPSLELT
ncbi:MAG TPA: helix-turn-helix transcriptional regulator [Gemmatimonadaceae bacterium]|nr:helix-turn-helix transcriptional regulator [Gemmatimonadaceae bacterium]